LTYQGYDPIWSHGMPTVAMFHHAESYTDHHVSAKNAMVGPDAGSRASHRPGI